MIEINTPWVQTATLNPPTLQDNTADADRLISALKANIQSDAIDVDLALLKKLPALLRKWEYRVRCIVFKDRHRWLLTGITDAADATPIAGLAIDLGTTRVVLRLIDLVTGRHPPIVLVRPVEERDCIHVVDALGILQNVIHL